LRQLLFAIRFQPNLLFADEHVQHREWPLQPQRHTASSGRSQFEKCRGCIYYHKRRSPPPYPKTYLFWCSVINIASYLKRRHPRLPARPLIDYHLAFVLLPLQLIGSQVGVRFNSFLPSCILVAGIALTLGYAICKLAQKIHHSRATKNKGQISSQYSLTELSTSATSMNLSHTNSPAHHAPAAVSTLQQQQQHFK